MKLNALKRLYLSELINNELIRYVEKHPDGKVKRLSLDKEMLQELLQDLVYLSRNRANFNALQLIDLEGISFDGINVEYADFENTNADINPQTVKNKSLLGTNLKGLDMSGKYFGGVDIYMTCLEDTNFIRDNSTLSKEDESLEDDNLVEVDIKKLIRY